MDTSLGERIKEIRKMKGISQEELAHMCEVSPGAVSHWENDLSRPTGTNIEKLLSALGISESTLFSPSTEIIPSNEILRELLEVVSTFEPNAQKMFLEFAKVYERSFGTDLFKG